MFYFSADVHTPSEKVEHQVNLIRKLAKFRETPYDPISRTISCTKFKFKFSENNEFLATKHSELVTFHK